jgi:RNA recognition motif-containing protein
MNIYVGNLKYEVSEDDLKELFEEFGEVTSIKIINDNYTGKSKGFGFVEMANDKEGNAAIEGLNDRDLNGRNLRVNLARERNDNRNRE